ncbi:hypothetical protein LTS18_005925, partial [Coniosporium uncinatum]
PIDSALLTRFTKLTGRKPHRFLRRGIFHYHRDFNEMLDYYENGDTFLLYTGRGPSTGSMHLGHTVSFEFTRYLQEALDVPVVIMLSDDEKALRSGGSAGDFSDAAAYARENIKDLIALGFDLSRTFIHTNSGFVDGQLGSYPHAGSRFRANERSFARLVSVHAVQAAFGFDGSASLGYTAYPIRQCAGALASSYPEVFGVDPAAAQPSAERAKMRCLIPMEIDQDPFFRLLCRNGARAGEGADEEGKMSASKPNSAIFLTDTEKVVEREVKRYAYSGGRETLEEHRMYGGDTDVDVAYQFLRFFEEDDERSEEVREGYQAGRLLGGELKKICVRVLQEYVRGFQERREKVTEEVVVEFMRPRRLAGNVHCGNGFKGSEERD